MKKLQGRNTALRRQWMILIRLNNSSNGVSKTELAQEHNVSKRTISRDISTLSSSGFPIYEDYYKDKQGQVYYKLVKDYKFPTLHFEIEELMDLFNLYYSIVTKNPYAKKSFTEFFKKIKFSIEYEMKLFFKDADKIFITENTPQIKYNEELEEIIFTIYEAIKDDVKITFNYFSMRKKEKKRYVVSPLAITYFNLNYYMAGYLKEKDKVYTWALNRISNINQTSFIRNKINFNPDEYFNSGFGIYTGKTFLVRIKFLKEIAPFIKERIWHKKQKIFENKDGSIILELPVNSLSEIKKMVLSYGKNAIVLEPKELVVLIKEEIISLKKLYKIQQSIK